MDIIIKSDEFSIKKTITNKNDPIVKKVNLNNYTGMLSEIYIQSMPKYLDKIVITGGGQKIFMWNRYEIEECVEQNKNILSKYQLNQIIPISNKSYHNFEMNFIYNNEKVYNDCIIEKNEYIEKVASEDNEKIVEYWDMDDECVCQAYGVKYEQVKKVKDMIMSSPKINSPEVKIVLQSNCLISNKENYEIEFFDDMLGRKNYLRYVNGMYSLAYTL